MVMRKVETKNICEYCKSDHVVCHGIVKTQREGKRQRYKCQECAHTFYIENKENKE
jgi:transposase-like protein